MHDEYLNIYNKNNELIGTKLRSLVHKEGDWHRTVHIYIINEKGEILTHLRSPFVDKHPSQWDTRFGGHVIAGSDYDDTVLKELQEEIGLDANINDLITVGIGKYDGGDNREFPKKYVLKFKGNVDSLKFNDGEVIALKWLSPEAISQAIVTNSEQWVSSKEDFEQIVKEIK